MFTGPELIGITTFALFVALAAYAFSRFGSASDEHMREARQSDQDVIAPRPVTPANKPRPRKRRR
jgi:hypothetical protein